MIHIEVKSDSISSILSRISRELSDMSPMMDSIGMELEKRISNRFETETDPNGKRWTEWKSSTRKSYPKDGNRRILDRTQEMLRSLGHESDSNSVLVGFGKPYAKYHELGTKKMAQRGMIFSDPDKGTLSTADEEAVIGIVNGYLRRIIG